MKKAGMIIFAVIGVFFAICSAICLNAALNSNTLHTTTFAVFGMISVGCFAAVVAAYLDLIS